VVAIGVAGGSKAALGELETARRVGRGLNPRNTLVFQRSRLTDLTFAEECGSDADTVIADRGSVAKSVVAFLCRIRSIAGNRP
jgi:hypothetical protein